MIIKSTFRQTKGLEVHLLRNDTNENVNVRTDFFRGGPLDLHLALRLMDGISRSNARATRSVIHVVIAPGKPLDDQAIAATLATIEGEFGIAADAPRALVQHAKGNRPSHFHAVYSLVDLRTGRAIKSHDNYAKDELVSRRLELRFGETIVPGPRLDENVAELRARGATDEADQLALLQAAPDRHPPSRHDRRQAERLGLDPAAMSQHVYGLYETANRDLGVFARSLASYGYHLCDGNKAVIVGIDESGFQTSLIRCLRREGKANGRPVDLREWHLQQELLHLKPKTVERDAGLSRARAGAARELDAEWQRGAFEALADADASALAAFRAKRKKQREDQEQAERELSRATLKIRRDAIFELHRLRDEARWLRVDRAFRMARLFGSPGLRRLAFALAATGVLMTGAGLIAALLAGTVARAALPTVRQARQLSAGAKRERIRDRRSREAALKEVYERTRTEGKRSSSRTLRFSFDQVAKPDRILAGHYAVALLGQSNASNIDLTATVESALGPEVVHGIRNVLERGSTLQVRRLTHWVSGVPEGQRDRSIAAALARHRVGKAEPVDVSQKPHSPLRRTPSGVTGRNEQDGTKPNPPKQQHRARKNRGKSQEKGRDI